MTSSHSGRADEDTRKLQNATFLVIATDAAFRPGNSLYGCKAAIFLRGCHGKAASTNSVPPILEVKMDCEGQGSESAVEASKQCLGVQFVVAGPTSLLTAKLHIENLDPTNNTCNQSVLPPVVRRTLLGYVERCRLHRELVQVRRCPLGTPTQAATHGVRDSC